MLGAMSWIDWEVREETRDGRMARRKKVATRTAAAKKKPKIWPTM